MDRLTGKGRVWLALGVVTVVSLAGATAAAAFDPAVEATNSAPR